MKKTSIFFFALLAAFLLIPAGARAFAVKTGDIINVPTDRTIDGNLYAMGNSITIDGTVIGDVVCGASESVSISGRVEGDVICAAKTINIGGWVGGSARIAAKTIEVGGRVDHNLQAFGESIVLGDGAGAGWDVFIFAQSGEINGLVGGSLYGAAVNVKISGRVEGDIVLRLNKKIESGTGADFKPPLIVAERAGVGGDLTYTAGSKAVISEGAEISGHITHNLPEETFSRKTLIRGWAWGRLFSVFSAMVVGLAVVSLWPKRITVLTDRMLGQAGTAVGWGVALTFITPVAAILLMVTVIGIPLSLIVLFFWILGLYLSKIIVGILVGRSIMEKIWHKEEKSPVKAMALGIVLCWMIFSVPVVGWMLSFLAVWWGLGGIWLYLKGARE